MSFLRSVPQIAFAIVLVGTIFMALFGAGRLIDTVLSTYVLKYETCEYKAPNRSVEFPEESVPENCFVDYNRAKNDIAGGFAMFFVSAPIAYLAFKRVRQ